MVASDNRYVAGVPTPVVAGSRLPQRLPVSPVAGVAGRCAARNCVLGSTPGEPTGLLRIVPLGSDSLADFEACIYPAKQPIALFPICRRDGGPSSRQSLQGLDNGTGGAAARPGKNTPRCSINHPDLRWKLCLRGCGAARELRILPDERCDGRFPRPGPHGTDQSPPQEHLFIGGTAPTPEPLPEDLHHQAVARAFFLQAPGPEVTWQGTVRQLWVYPSQLLITLPCATQVLRSVRPAGRLEGSNYQGCDPFRF
jgi:hypothetical protein